MGSEDQRSRANEKNEAGQKDEGSSYENGRRSRNRSSVLDRRSNGRPHVRKEEKNDSVHRQGSRKHTKHENGEDESSLIDAQIFAEPSEDVEDALVGGTSAKAIRESVLSYKRDTKNFFVGDLLGNCSRRARRHDDQWYVWTKDMMEAIDKNEAAMTKFLLAEGHGKLGSLMEDGCSSWSLTIDDKVRDLMDGLRSIESMIRSEKGMKTIWGRIKYRGVFKNSVRHYLSKARNGTSRKLDLVDYARYRGKKWDSHFEKMRNREEQEDLYS